MQELQCFATGGHARAFKITSKGHHAKHLGRWPPIKLWPRHGTPLLENMGIFPFSIQVDFGVSGILISEAARGEGGRLFNSEVRDL